MYAEILRSERGEYLIDSRLRMKFQKIENEIQIRSMNEGIEKIFREREFEEKDELDVVH